MEAALILATVAQRYRLEWQSGPSDHAGAIDHAATAGRRVGEAVVTVKIGTRRAFMARWRGTNIVQSSADAAGGGRTEAPPGLLCQRMKLSGVKFVQTPIFCNSTAKSTILSPLRSPSSTNPFVVACHCSSPAFPVNWSTSAKA
jgi:hypothetical protein